MIESLFEIGISNAIISLAISAAAVLVGRFTNRPHLAHFLWLLVLAKLLMPAIIPVSYNYLPEKISTVSSAPLEMQTIALETEALSELQVGNVNSIAFSDILPMAKSFGLTYLPMIWGLGILIALVWSLFRVLRFDRLLRSSAEKAPRSIYEMADELSKKLSLKKLPSINITNAEISPMVWWIGGKVKVVLPKSLISNMEPEQIRLVLAHELAHVKRRDFAVRWVEWSAAVLFWWNPVVWWAQRNLRANEEICCDALILSRLNPKPQDYAASLLSAVENFTEPAFRPPAMASEINSGGYLVRRIHMILSSNNKQTLSGRMQIAVLVGAALILPLGITFAQDKESKPELERRVEKIKEDAKAGKISNEEAKAEISEIKRRLEISASERKLDAAVKAGKISKEDAKKKLEAMSKTRGSKLHKVDELKYAAEKIESALKEGKISKVEAEERMRELKLRHVQELHKRQLYLATEKLHTAVKANKISQYEAQARLHNLKRNFASATIQMHSQLAAEKLEMALKAGKISKEEAHLRMDEIKRRLNSSSTSDQLKQAAEKLELAVKANQISQAEAEKKMNALQLEFAKTESDSRIKNAAKTLKLELEAGRVSKEEATARLAELRMRHNNEKRMFYLKQAQEKLEAAVESGNMSPEEAKKKMLEIEKTLKKKP